MKRCQRTESTSEKESEKGPPHRWPGRSLRARLSRGVPADHEAQSQVKEKRRSSCRSEGAQSKLHPKKDGAAKFKIG